MDNNNFHSAAELILNSSFTSLFSGAGISVESGIPPFRGEGGIWGKYDPKYLDINFFKDKPEESWQVIREIFYDSSLNVNPNSAHNFFSRLETNGLLQVLITQNIDDLHRRSGSYNVIEIHGSVKKLICISCRLKSNFNKNIFENLPPKCSNCGSILKPDFIFFGEPLPAYEFSTAIENSKKSDLQIIVGTSGEVFPASKIPFTAKDEGAKIIEINTTRSNYTDTITDIFLEGKAGDICSRLSDLIFTENK